MIRKSLRLLVALTFLSMSVTANATLQNCNDLYVVRINVDASNASQGVVFAESKSATSGSFYTYLNTSLTDREYQQLSAMLLTAKATGGQVHVETSASDKCSILSNSYFIMKLELEP